MAERQQSLQTQALAAHAMPPFVQGTCQPMGQLVVEDAHRPLAVLVGPRHEVVEELRHVAVVEL